MTLGLNSYFSTKNHIFVSSFLVPAEINQFKPQFASAVLTPTLVLCLKPHESTFFYGLFSLFYTQTKAKSKNFWSISKNFSWNQIQHISQTITTPPCTLTTPFPDNHKPATHTPYYTSNHKPPHISYATNATAPQISVTAAIMTTGLAGGLFCGYKPLFPACV